MEQEEKVLYHLAEAWNAFNKLQKQHPQEQDDFLRGIHLCQYLMGMRYARRYRSDIFPDKGEST